MFHSDIEILEGAFVISDAHYSDARVELLEFFKAIDVKELKPTQIILFGDIFDVLFGGINKTIIKNNELISLINNISQYIEIVYLEGNHDFNLKNIFPNVKVFTISQQPVQCSYKTKKVYIAHGDFDGDFGYQIYTYLIRSRFILISLNIVNSLFSNIILNKLDKYLAKKDDCKEFIGFKDFTFNRLNTKYSCDYFIEGHFHQNKVVSINDFEYVNLAAFACNQRYFIVKSSKEKMLLEEKIFSKET